MFEIFTDGIKKSGTRVFGGFLFALWGAQSLIAQITGKSFSYDDGDWKILAVIVSLFVGNKIAEVKRAGDAAKAQTELHRISAGTVVGTKE